MREMNEINSILFDKETETLTSCLFSFLVDWEMKRSLRYQNFVSLLIFEPDQKPQDTETLRTLVTLIRKHIRETDLIGRIGNTRFGLLLIKSNLDGAYITASRIVEHVDNYIFSQEKFQHLSLSIGGACFPTNITSLKTSDLFKHAENAFKVARQKNKIIYFPGLPILRAAGGEQL